MAKRPALLFSLLALAMMIVSPAFVRSADKKAEKEAKIAALEEQLHQLRAQEKAALGVIDQRYNHTISSLDPKEVHRQMEEILKVLHHVQEVFASADSDYGGHKHDARESVGAAERQIKKALEHDTAEERDHAAHDLNDAYADVDKALAYSAEKYGIGDNKKPQGQPESQAVSDQALMEELPKIGLAHHLIAATDHEIHDYEQEKHKLKEQRDAEKKETRERFGPPIKELEEKIAHLKK